MEGQEVLRPVHPWAWWCWAIGTGLAVSGTTNPLLLALIAMAVIVVVIIRRTAAPWARSVRAYLLLSLFVIGMRVFFQIVIGGSGGETVLFTLPEVPLPDWAAGIRLGGAVTAEALSYTLYDALRLAVMLLCIGAANALANPRQALKSVPAALYEASVAVVIALTVAPQLIESALRVRRARRLRGDPVRGLRALGRIALPVLGDAIERSMALAAGMEARGFARTRGLAAPGALPLMVGSVLLAVFGAFLLLSTPYWAAATVALILGMAGTGWGLRRAGSNLRVTSHRPHPWSWRSTGVALTGVGAAAIVLTLGWLESSYESVFPTTDPLVWPELTMPMLLAAAFCLAPLALTVPPQFRPVGDSRADTRVRTLRAAAALPDAR